MKDLHRKDDRVLWALKKIIHLCLKALSLLMTIIIFLGVIDVAWMIYQKIIAPPAFVLSISDILATFGAFMVVLIAIEIFQNIILYLRDNVIHVKIVLATALMAIARKVIILDFDELSPMYVLGTAAVLLATGITYYVVHKIPDSSHQES
ncbi:phosphate-starvation-inducible PsiE family protein [Desulfogranum marinum]|jgi:uncharacterized membrane protein (DUF373 family)|uniref:phosphate-starvation-inducible PsiE family protein n=1 Tax=Desulfogranum marinum TaxID=453220 RepID=UPI0029C85283|nr:phosphate-starvation-inducible PsiE family protein [Desulfogranum marinum]